METCEYQDEKELVNDLLGQKLGPEHLAKRPGSSGMSFAYLESWKVIELANAILGFDGWSCNIVDVTPDFIEHVGKNFSVGVTAIVKVSLKNGTSHEDVGYGMCSHPQKGIAIENAKKEAVSDARKRALRLWGNSLGNCVYDKQHLATIKSRIGKRSSGSVKHSDLRQGTVLTDPRESKNSSSSSKRSSGSSDIMPLDSNPYNFTSSSISSIPLPAPIPSPTNGSNSLNAVEERPGKRQKTAPKTDKPCVTTTDISNVTLKKESVNVPSSHLASLNNVNTVKTPANYVATIAQSRSLYTVSKAVDVSCNERSYSDSSKPVNPPAPSKGSSSPRAKKSNRTVTM